MNRILLPFSVVFASMFFMGCNSSLSETKATENIREQVQKGALLVDVRTPQEFELGSVPGAINIPLDQIENRIQDFKGHSSVIVFCKSGSRSAQAKSKLEANGITNITNGVNVANMEKELK